MATGCGPTATGLMQIEPDALALREMQTRVFKEVSDETLLRDCIGVLQDLGFTIKGAKSDLGIAFGVKEREAKATGQRAALVAMLILLAAAGGQAAPGVIDVPEQQTISVLVVTRPVASGGQEVRVSFHRFVRQPLMFEATSLRDPQLYVTFFELLSKAMFLEKEGQ